MKNPTPPNPAMTDNLLFEHFATLATAPDGIARLRELILQLAVQGKLGTQDAGDEPALKLMERIRKEKERLVKEGKISKLQLKDSITTDENLPGNWLFGKLEDFFYRIPVTKNKIPTSSFQKEGSSPIIDQSQNFIAGYTDEKSKILKISGPVLIFGDHTREIKYIDFNFVVGADGVIVLKPLNGFEKYFYLVMRSIHFEDKGYSRHFKILSNYYFPLPPLAEQHRIVAKVDRLFALCDELEARQQQERAGCLKLGTASLAGLQNADSPEEFGRLWAQVCDEFEMILDCPENVAVLRQTILQLAVKGRLVRQEPGDEPAGKIRSKQSDPIRDEEKQYTIPDSWTWIRLGDAIESMANGIYKPGVFYSDDGIACLRMYNINSGKINFTKLKRMVLNDQEMRQYLLKHGDLLVNRVNSRELVGKAAVIPELTEPVIFESKNIRVRFNTEILLPDFVNILFQTKEVWQVWQGNAKQTCGQASVSQPQIAGICTPLPPLAEQHRIVAKVNSLMASCDALESRLKERAGVQGKFANAVVKQVAGG